MSDFDLSRRFQEFYAALAAEVAALAGAPREGGVPLAAPVAERLGGLLERQALSWRSSHGDLAVELFRHAQYVMAALADETLIQLDWSGREDFKGQLLETRLFGTYRAGEMFFARLDALLAKRDVIYSELAKIYLLALILGFEGKLRGRPEAAAELAHYRTQLFRLIYQRDPGVRGRTEQLFQDAYAVTLDEVSPRRMPQLAPWVLVITLLVTAWIALSFPLWNRLTEDLEAILLGILT